MHAVDIPGVDPCRVILINDELTLELFAEEVTFTNEATKASIHLGPNEAMTVIHEIKRYFKC